ncbi:hypothetical protein ACFPYM_09415 [Methylobacterium hispanicum]|nr:MULTISPECIES: hypothetical protein [Methylobacterium]
MPAYQGYAASKMDARCDAAVIAMLTAPASASPDLSVVDPIFAAIEKDRALAAEHIRLLSISGSKPDDDPSWEPTHDASDAQWEHWREALLKTVPTTAAGCAALARYANEWVEREGVGLDEDGAKIFDLIGRSPLHTAPCPPASPDPVYAAIAAMHAADAAYSAWHAEYERVGLDAAGGFEAEAPLINEQTRAEEAALATVPVTSGGRAALVTFTDLCIARRGHTDGTAQEGEDTVFHWAYRALASAIRGESPQSEAEDAEALGLVDIKAALTNAPAWTGEQA